MLPPKTPWAEWYKLVGDLERIDEGMWLEVGLLVLMFQDTQIEHRVHKYCLEGKSSGESLDVIARLEAGWGDLPATTQDYRNEERN